MAVQQDDLLEPVVGEALGDVEHVVHEVLEVGVDRAGKVHHVAGVAVGDDRQHAASCRGSSGRRRGRSRSGQIEIDVERQVRPVLLDGAARQDADLAQLDRVVDLGPGQFLVTIFGRGSAWHGLLLGDGRFWRQVKEVRLAGCDNGFQQTVAPDTNPTRERGIGRERTQTVIDIALISPTPRTRVELVGACLTYCARIDSGRTRSHILADLACRYHRL